MPFVEWISLATTDTAGPSDAHYYFRASAEATPLRPFSLSAVVGAATSALLAPFHLLVWLFSAPTNSASGDSSGGTTLAREPEVIEDTQPNAFILRDLHFFRNEPSLFVKV